MGWQAIRDLWANHGPEWSAALAFYAVLSLFPLLLAGAVLASYVVDGAWAVTRVTAVLGEFLPSGDDEIRDIVGRAVADPRRVGLLSVAVYLVAGRRVLGALTTALNLVSDVDERADGIGRRIALEASLLVGLAALFLLGLSSATLLHLAWDAARLAPTPDSLTFRLVRFGFQALLLLVVFFLVYTVVPRGRREARATMVGAAAATLLFLLARAAFLVILAPLSANLDVIYGPLAVPVLLLLWAWYVALITLFGGSLASHTKTMLLEGDSPAQAARSHVSRPQGAEELARR